MLSTTVSNDVSQSQECGLATAAGVVTVAATLSACGGGAEGDAASSTNQSKAGTDAQASRFLSMAAFGGTDAGVAQLKEQTYNAWLDQQLSAPRSLSYKNWLIEKGFNLVGTNNANANGNGGWDQAVWCKLLSSPDVLRQRMVLAWSELFVISAQGLNITWRNFAIANYLDLLETHAFGNFRDLLEAVTLSSAMGTYLNMKGNKKANPLLNRVPDENFAREVMQLFTIGLYELNEDGSTKLDSTGKPIETYDNADTQGLAAVFTGWKSAGGDDPSGTLQAAAFQNGFPMQFDEGDHSSTEKRFLGTVIPANTGGVKSLQMALDALFLHANTPPFVSKYLIQRFVTSNPSGAYVQRVVRVFKNNGKGVRGDMSAVIKAVLLDEEALANPTGTTQGKLREPMIRLIQWARTFGATSSDNLWNLGFTHTDTTLGQMPLYAPSVFNFFRPGYVPPNSDLAAAKLVAPEFQIASEPTVVGYVNYMAGTVNNARAVKAAYSEELNRVADAQALVDRCNLLLAANQLSTGTVSTIKNAIERVAVTTDAGKLNRIYACVLLVMSSPEYLIMK